MLLPVGTAVAGVTPQRRPQVSEYMVVRGRGPAVPPLGPWYPDSHGAQGGGQVPTGLRRSMVEVARHLDPGDRLDVAGEVHYGQSAGPAILGEDQRARLAQNLE